MTLDKGTRIHQAIDALLQQERVRVHFSSGKAVDFLPSDRLCILINRGNLTLPVARLQADMIVAGIGRVVGLETVVLRDTVVC